MRNGSKKQFKTSKQIRESKIIVDKQVKIDTWKTYMEQLFFSNRQELLQLNNEIGPSILVEEIQSAIWNARHIFNFSEVTTCQWPPRYVAPLRPFKSSIPPHIPTTVVDNTGHCFEKERCAKKPNLLTKKQADGSCWGQRWTKSCYPKWLPTSEADRNHKRKMHTKMLWVCRCNILADTF